MFVEIAQSFCETEKATENSVVSSVSINSENPR